MCPALLTVVIVFGLRGVLSSAEVVWGWDLAEWSERCAIIPKITGSNPSGGSELTFRSDLLLTERGCST
jgi:hypothetical protein